MKEALVRRASAPATMTQKVGEKLIQRTEQQRDQMMPDSHVQSSLIKSVTSKNKIKLKPKVKFESIDDELKHMIKKKGFTRQQER